MPNPEKIILPCPSCQSQYNVSNLPAGTKFKCQNCGTIITVPVPRAAQPIRPAARPVAAQHRPAAPYARPPARGVRPQTADSEEYYEENERPGYKARTYGRKQNPVLLYGGIVFGILALIIGISIIFSDSGGNSNVVTETNKIKKEEPPPDKDKREQIQDSFTDKTLEALKEKRPDNAADDAVKLRPTSTTKKKLDIDATLKTEVLPLLESLPKQSGDQFDSTKNSIIVKGKKVIPILIQAIAHKDKQVARYASEILIKMTSRTDAPNVNPMVGTETLKEYSKDWEDWWFANMDKIPD